MFWPYTEFESRISTRSSGGPLGNLSIRVQNLRRVFFFAPNKRSYTNSKYLCYQKCGGAVLKQKGKQKHKHNVRTYRFLPADTRYIRIWYIVRTWYHTVVACDNNSGLPTPPLKPRLVEHTHSFFFKDVALYCGVTQVGIRNSLRSNRSWTEEGK